MSKKPQSFLPNLNSKQAALAGLFVLLLILPITVVILTNRQNISSKAQVAGGWPTTPPAQVCGNTSILGGGPTTAPAGAITVPAGNNESVDFRKSNTTYWFAPGVHTLGNGQFDQIIPGDNATFIGAPGAIIDGQNLNNFAFTQHGKNVRIAFLEIRNFVAPRDQGVVNHDQGKGWTIENNWIHHNKGAGVFAGTDNTLRYNCLADNGQYGFQVYSGDESEIGPSNVIIDHNEVARNNTDDWETVSPGCGCTGGAKFWLSNNVKVTNNWVHHNMSTGLWFDNNNRGSLVEHNFIEENHGQGVFIEAGYDAQIRYNYFKRNAIESGREFARKNDPFPIGAIYVSENGSPDGFGLLYVPTVISNNYFDNNWGGVNLWENADRYSGSTAHTHVSGTIKIGDLINDTKCKSSVTDDIPNTIDPYVCRWSTENVIVENNEFHIDKAAIGTDCAGKNYCGISGIFANVGSYPEFSGYEIPWRITFRQDNIFRNNKYFGEWMFAGFQTTKPDGTRVSWADWTAPAPPIPATYTHANRPTTFGQDQGSTYNGMNPAPTTAPGQPTNTPTPRPTGVPNPNALDDDTATLEGSVGKWISWFSSTVSRSAVEAHSGTGSLQIDVTAPDGWGVEISNWPGFAVSPGNKTLSYWGKLGSGNTTKVTMQIKWIDANNALLRTDPVVIATLSDEWQKTTVTTDAPAGSETVLIDITGSGSAGSRLFLDDFVLADTTALATPTPLPTATSVPTPTIEPTATPRPTNTPTPKPTAITLPTVTPIVSTAGNALNVNTAGIEGGLGSWKNWYSTSLARSAEAAHSGTYSMKVRVSAANGWGVQLGNWPGFAASPGTKTIRFWGRSGTGTNTKVTMRVKWYNANRSLLRTSQIVIPALTTTWQKAETIVTAPAGTASVYAEFSGNNKPGTTFYLDDIFISK